MSTNSLLLNVSDTTSTCLGWPDVTFETGSTPGLYVANAVLNSVLAVLATISNVLVFLAIRKSTSIRLPSKLLLASLVVADLGVGLIGQPLFVTFLVAKVEKLFAVACFSVNIAGVLGAGLAGSSLLTMTLMSVDRFLAFHVSLQYRQIVTARRVIFALGSSWLLSIVAGSMWIWTPEQFYVSIPLIVVSCTLVTSLAYTSIYRGLRAQRRVTTKPLQTANHTPAGQGNRDLSNYRKAASAMFWVYFIFLLCYIPLVCCVLAIQISGIDLLTRQIFEISQTILLMNSSVNPFVYCWRIPDVRAGVIGTIRGIVNR